MAGTYTSFGEIGSSQEPDAQGKLVVFDPQVFKRTKQELNDWDASRNEWNDVYSTFKKDWAGSQPAAEGRAKQESSFLDKFYNGDFASYLGSLRAREGDARRAAGDRALQFARGATDRASLLRGDPTGNSSASRAMALRFGRDIENDVALNDVARERGDFDYLNRAQQSQIGQRQKLLDSVVQRKLLPHQLNNQELSFAIQSLSGIQQTRLGAASPVFWRDKPLSEEILGAVDSLMGYSGGAPAQTGTPSTIPTTAGYSASSSPAPTGMSGMQGQEAAAAAPKWYDMGI